MKMRPLDVLQRFVESPRVNLVVGLILLATSLSETLLTLDENLANGTVQGHHGLLVYSLYVIVKQIPELFAGTEKLTVAKR